MFRYLDEAVIVGLFTHSERFMGRRTYQEQIKIFWTEKRTFSKSCECMNFLHVDLITRFSWSSLCFCLCGKTLAYKFWLTISFISQSEHSTEDELVNSTRHCQDNDTGGLLCRREISNGDHPLCLANGSFWNQYFKVFWFAQIIILFCQ